MIVAEFSAILVGLVIKGIALLFAIAFKYFSAWAGLVQLSFTVHPRLSGPQLSGSSINRSCEFAAERRESTIKQTSILSFFRNSTDES